VLVELLETADREKKFYVLTILRELGPDAKEAIPALQRLADSENVDERLRETAAHALKAIKKP
jgi:HEAT repeat protein